MASNPTSQQSDEMRSLLKVASFAVALALGCAMASLQALTQGPSGLTFRFSVWTVAAFIAGATAALLYWKFALASFRAGRRRALFLGMAAAGVGMFLYPLRFVPPDKLYEISIGLATAVCAIALIAVMLLRLARFFNADARQAESSPPAAKKRSRH